MKRMLLIIATFFYVGRIKFAPGTWTSLVTMVLVFFITPYWQAPVYIQLVVIGVIFLIGIPAATESERFFEKQDPGQCTIDETVGQMIALLWVPHHWKFYIAAFVLFRLFDILKPQPVRLAERPAKGVGIMLDDVVAGLYAMGVLHLLRYVI